VDESGVTGVVADTTGDVMSLGVVVGVVGDVMSLGVVVGVIGDVMSLGVVVGVVGDVMSLGVVVGVVGDVMSLGVVKGVVGDLLSLGVVVGVVGDVLSLGVVAGGVSVVSTGVDETGVPGVLSGGADGGFSIAPGAVVDGNVSALLVSSPVSCVSSAEICCSSCCICCNCACIGWSEPAVVWLAFALAASLPEAACVCSTPAPPDVRFLVTPESLPPPIPRVWPDLPELPKRNGAILDIQELLGVIPLAPLALDANGEDCPCVTPLLPPAVCAAIALVLVLGANSEIGVCAVFVHVLESFCCSTLSVLLLFAPGDIACVASPSAAASGSLATAWLFISLAKPVKLCIPLSLTMFVRLCIPLSLTPLWLSRCSSFAELVLSATEWCALLDSLCDLANTWLALGRRELAVLSAD
jgi:hypothetical protein